jgi:arylsulfatase
MNPAKFSFRFVLPLALALTAMSLATDAFAQDKKPNILFIMGDDIGMWNIGAYHRGMMAGKTPNLDKMAKEGMLFTDYYAEASCTAGRANFITGELPIRTGMTTVGQAGAPTGLPAKAVTIATVLKSMGYATGQFGKNHLGDKNSVVPAEVRAVARPTRPRTSPCAPRRNRRSAPVEELYYLS